MPSWMMLLSSIVCFWVSLADHDSFHPFVCEFFKVHFLYCELFSGVRSCVDSYFVDYWLGAIPQDSEPVIAWWEAFTTSGWGIANSLHQAIYLAVYYQWWLLITITEKNGPLLPCQLSKAWRKPQHWGTSTGTRIFAIRSHQGQILP